MNISIFQMLRIFSMVQALWLIDFYDLLNSLEISPDCDVIECKSMFIKRLNCNKEIELQSSEMQLLIV